MANLTSEFALDCMPGPLLVANFDTQTARKPAEKKIIYYDENDGDVVAAIDKRDREYDVEKAVKSVLPSKREGLAFKNGVSRDQALYGQRQFGQNAALMKARHVQDLSSLEQIDQDRLDPDCCKSLPVGYMDFRIMVGRGKSEKLRANSPPRQNPDLMNHTKTLRDLLPGEGRLNNIAELSAISGEIKLLRRERRFLPMTKEELNT